MISLIYTNDYVSVYFIGYVIAVHPIYIVLLVIFDSFYFSIKYLYCTW